jgi:hypothetical protein
VDAGVDDEAAGAECDRLQVTELPDGIVFICAELVGELLRIQRPAFGVGIEGEQLADERHLVRVFALPDVTRDRLVERQVGQREPAVQVRRPQVDPEAAGDLAVDGTGAAVRRRRAGLLFGWQALHFHVRIDQGVERTRQLGPDPREPLLYERQDFGAAGVAFREPVFGIVGEGIHPLADRSTGEADSLHDRVHLRVELLELALPHRVDFVRRHGRGGRRPERPAVELVAIRARPHARIVGRDFPLCLELLDLPVERRRDLLRGDRRRARRPRAGNRRRPSRNRFDQRAARARTLG